MQNATEYKNRITVTAGGFRRIAILASVCGFALAAVALPVTVDDGGLAVTAAYAAGGNGNGRGNGRGDAPGQQKDDIADTGEAGDADAESAISGSGENEEVSDELPIADDSPANARVIKELAGLSDDSELSEEEELEAIRSGWGTWRTADGPDSVIAQ